MSTLSSPDEVVAPHDPLVGGHPGLGRPGDMGPQLGPGVGGGGHLGQRAEGEAAGAGHQHAGGLPSRRFQRQPVLGVAGHRPQLVAPLDRPAAPVAQVDDAGPVAVGAQMVDPDEQPVHVAHVDELPGGQWTGHQMSGQG